MSDAACILGIDSGLSGACAYYFPSAPDRVAAEDMPVVAGAVDCATLAARIAQMAPSLAVVERVASMPKQGVASTFKFGASYGAVLGAAPGPSRRKMRCLAAKGRGDFSGLPPAIPVTVAYSAIFVTTGQE
jgi:hypothetical protein